MYIYIQMYVCVFDMYCIYIYIYIYFKQECHHDKNYKQNTHLQQRFQSAPGDIASPGPMRLRFTGNTSEEGIMRHPHLLGKLSSSFLREVSHSFSNFFWSIFTTTVNIIICFGQLPLRLNNYALFYVNERSQCSLFRDLLLLVLRS